MPLISKRIVQPNKEVILIGTHVIDYKDVIPYYITKRKPVCLISETLVFLISSLGGMGNSGQEGALLDIFIRGQPFL